MADEVKAVKIEVEGLEQLILLSSAMPLSIINIDEEKKVAFVFLHPFASITPIIYYCKLDKIPENKFAYLDRVMAKIRFGDQFSAEPNEVNIPLIRVKSAGLGL